jgi:hypothetical protein
MNMLRTARHSLVSKDDKHVGDLCPHFNDVLFSIWRQLSPHVLVGNSTLFFSVHFYLISLTRYSQTISKFVVVLTAERKARNSGRTNRLLSFDRTRTAWKTTLPEIAAENLTEPLASNDSGIHIQIHRLMGSIYVLRSDARFHKDLFRYSKVIRGDKHTQSRWR